MRKVRDNITHIDNTFQLSTDVEGNVAYKEFFDVFVLTLA